MLYMQRMKKQSSLVGVDFLTDWVDRKYCTVPDVEDNDNNCLLLLLVVVIREEKEVDCQEEEEFSVLFCMECGALFIFA
jgi:hypothetical protein